MSDGYKVYASQEYVDNKTSEKNYKTINGQSILGEGDISTGEKWVLLQSSDDVEIRNITQTCSEEYIRYVVLLTGRTKESSVSWRLFENNNMNASLYQQATIGDHVYGSGAFFFIELPKDAPALIFRGAGGTAGNNGNTTITQSYLGNKLSNGIGSFTLVPNDSSIEYISLSVKIWGIKA